MKHSARRRLDAILLSGSAVLIGAAASIGALAGDTERIGSYWTHGAIADDNRTQVVEVIDYDFGPLRRHGILRDIPDVDPGSLITVSSPTAPDAVDISAGFGETKLRIGDQTKTIHDRHRYRISYPIDSLVVGDRVSWNAVGLSWSVPINNVEIHVTAGHEFIDLECHRGQSGTQAGCDVTQIAPGHLVVQSTGLSPLEAITVEGTLGAALATMPTAPTAPEGAADDPGSGWLAPGLGSLGAALLAGGVISRRLRNLGKEQVWLGGAADAAFGPPSGTVVGFELLDYDELAQMATIEFASPRGLSAAAGGIIHAEKVNSEHQIAWLIECAIRDEIVLVEDDDDLSLTRGSATPHPAVVARLNAIFDQTDRVELGKYDSSFATAWGEPRHRTRRLASRERIVGPEGSPSTYQGPHPRRHGGRRRTGAGGARRRDCQPGWVFLDCAQPRWSSRRRRRHRGHAPIVGSSRFALQRDQVVGCRLSLFVGSSQDPKPATLRQPQGWACSASTQPGQLPLVNLTTGRPQSRPPQQYRDRQRSDRRPTTTLSRLRRRCPQRQRRPSPRPAAAEVAEEVPAGVAEVEAAGRGRSPTRKNRVPS